MVARPMLGFTSVALVAAQVAAAQGSPVAGDSAMESIANRAPYLLPFFNNGPVFGMPGTELGDVWNRTQLTGDWGGMRTTLAEHGWFIDLYSTSAHQNVFSGGLETSDSFVQNTQLTLNLDTGRAGLWPGGLFHFTLDSRCGSSLDKSLAPGTQILANTGVAFPGPTFDQEILPTEYFLLQALAPEFSVLVGKLRILTLADQTLFGNSYRYYFANLGLNKNPIALAYYNTTTIAALGAYTPTEWLTITGGVYDPNSQANNFANDAFDKVNLYTSANFNYSLGRLPGQFSPQFNWTNQPKTDLENPFGTLTPAQIPQAIGVLLGSNQTQGLPINEKSVSWATIANVSQYLAVLDDPKLVAEQVKSGQPVRGIGVFGRLGYTPPKSASVTADSSIALVASGLFERNYDSFGIGFHYDVVSRHLKNDLHQLAGASVSDERGLEVFYDFAITPAVRLIPSYQHLWSPLVADVVAGQDHTDLILLRLTIAF